VAPALSAIGGAAAAATAAGLSDKLLPQSVEDVFKPKPEVVLPQPPAMEGGAISGNVITQPPNVSSDIPINIPYGGEFMQQPTQAGIPMLGSPMVYSRVADIARQLARRGGIGGLATGVGIGGLAGSLMSADGRPITVPQQMRAVTGMAFTRKTQMAYKDLVEMTSLENAAACTGVPIDLMCRALIHRFPVRRRGISAAQLRTAKRVNSTVARMHKELATEFKSSTRRAPARRNSTVIQNS